MDYDLTKPCKNCSFRTDIPAFLTSGRVEEIQDSLERGEFPCHETIDYNHLHEIGHDEYKDKLPYDVSESAKHCAGALILLEKEEAPSQMMRIAERLRCYDRTKLDMDAPVFDTFDEMIDSQPR
jgi:hypothetical protein